MTRCTPPSMPHLYFVARANHSSTYSNARHRKTLTEKTMREGTRTQQAVVDCETKTKVPERKATSISFVAGERAASEARGVEARRVPRPNKGSCVSSRYQEGTSIVQCVHLSLQCSVHAYATYSVRKPVWSCSGSATRARPKSQICSEDSAAAAARAISRRCTDTQRLNEVYLQITCRVEKQIRGLQVPMQYVGAVYVLEAYSQEFRLIKHNINNLLHVK